MSLTASLSKSATGGQRLALVHHSMGGQQEASLPTTVGKFPGCYEWEVLSRTFPYECELPLKTREMRSSKGRFHGRGLLHAPWNYFPTHDDFVIHAPPQTLSLALPRRRDLCVTLFLAGVILPTHPPDMLWGTPHTPGREASPSEGGIGPPIRRIARPQGSVLSEDVISISLVASPRPTSGWGPPPRKKSPIWSHLVLFTPGGRPAP